MKRDDSLPLIRTKHSLYSNLKFHDIPNESLYTNESSINFANLKKNLKYLKMNKSKSTQDLFFTQKSTIPNSQSTSFLNNGKYSIEKDTEYNNNRSKFLVEEALYKKNYIDKFIKIKTNLYKKKFYNNNFFHNPKDTRNFDEFNKKNEDDKVSDEENIEKKIDFKLNLWEDGINLKNDKNYDIGDDNNIEKEQEITSESNNFPETNDLEINKESSDTNSNGMSLYLTEMQNFTNNNNDTQISTRLGNSTRGIKNINYNFKKIKIVGKRKKNPFRFTRYSSLDNIGNFHKLYREFNNLSRKHYINGNYSTYAFIKSCDKEKIVCNPLGLLKRKGDENILEMNNHHAGDSFVDCLSSGLKFTNNLNTLEMSNNRITQIGIEKFFSNLQEKGTFLKNLFKLNLSYNNIGEVGVENLVKYIEDKSCQLENLNIEGNNLGDKNINNLCYSISKSIWNRINYFNAGKNKITKNSEKGLLTLTEKCTELVVLILRNNQIDNSLGTNLMKNLNKLYSLKIFDISWNLIGNHLVYPLLYEEAVNFHPKQNNLFNNFELDKIKTIMKMNFNKNPLLPIIDKNSIGKTSKSKDKKALNDIIPEIKSINVPKRKPSNFAIEFSNYIKSNLCSLVHLNISHNNLPLEDCQLISEEIIANRTILGIHVEGNEMKIDPLGFIHPIQKPQKEKNYYSKTQITYDYENLKDLPKLLISPINKIRGRTNCWICECWRESEFVLDLKIKELKPKYTIAKIHLDFENYEPSYMIYKKNCFKLIKMCPPGRVKFFFTIDGNPVINCYKEYDYKTKEYEKPIKYTFNEEYIEEYNNIKSMLINSIDPNEKKNNINYGEYVDIQEDQRDEENKLVSKTIYINNYGIRNISPNSSLITQDYQSTLKYSIPRPEKISARIVKIISWKFTDSIWHACSYNYEGETDVFIDKVFEFDFNRAEYDSIFIKESEFIEAKNILKKNYRNIIECYINLSSFSGSNLWQINSDILIEWLNDKCDFFDDKYTSKKMIKIIEEIYFNPKDREDRKLYKSFPSNKYNLIRHTFLLFLVNISIDKFMNVLKTLSNPLDALKLSFDNYFQPALEGYNQHSWRKERYYNEEVDNYLKAFLPLLDGIYHTFSKQEKEKREKERKEKEEEVEGIINDKIDGENEEMNEEFKMTQEDFNNFILSFIDSDSDEYKINDNPLIYHISKKLQINEITNDEFLYLNLIEFCEALCRVIDIFSPIPPGDKIEDWPLEKRKEQSLIEKIENIMPIIFKKIDHPKFNVVRDKFISPLKDQITSLYIVDYKNNSIYNGYESYFNKNS